MLPPEPDLELIHRRTYEVKAYRKGLQHILLRGIVNDVKPQGLYIPEDPDPLDIHLMVVDLVVDVATMTIVESQLIMDVHPHTQCREIVPHYGKLVGLSIARGFSNKVRELFGGPRGCTHTTALLLAMGPVAIQSMWSMRAAMNRENESREGTPVRVGRKPTLEERQASFAMNLNTCHVWAADGEFVKLLEQGEEIEPPLWAIERMKKLGLDPDTWRERMAE